MTDFRYMPADHWEKKYFAEKAKNEHYEKEIKALKNLVDRFKGEVEELVKELEQYE